MKIAILTPGGVDRSGTGNVIPCLLWLIERLVRHGHEVHVFAAAQEPDPGRWPLLGASVHNAGRAPRSVRILRDLAREHRSGRFDVIHAFWAKYGTVGAVARRLFGVPLVLTLPGGDVVGLRDIGFGGLVTGRGRLILRCAVAAADAINTPSRFMRDLAIAHGIDAEHVVLGVDAQAFPPLAPRARDPQAPMRLLHVGSLNRVKDQPTLLGAMAILRARGVPFVLDVIGEDTLGGAIQALVASLELGRAVRFHGLVPFADVRPWYERADLLVVSSRHEAGPLVTLEAAMAGVPPWAPVSGISPTCRRKQRLRCRWAIAPPSQLGSRRCRATSRGACGWPRRPRLLPSNATPTILAPGSRRLTARLPRVRPAG